MKNYMFGDKKIKIKDSERSLISDLSESLIFIFLSPNINLSITNHLFEKYTSFKLDKNRSF